MDICGEEATLRQVKLGLCGLEGKTVNMQGQLLYW